MMKFPIALAGVLAVFPGCGGGAPDPGTFVGTWEYVNGAASFSCSDGFSVPPESLAGRRMELSFTDGGVLASRGSFCVVRHDVDGTLARVVPNESCTREYMVGGQTMTVSIDILVDTLSLESPDNLQHDHHSRSSDDGGPICDTQIVSAELVRVRDAGPPRDARP